MPEPEVAAPVVAPPPDKSAVEVFNETLAAQPDVVAAAPEAAAVVPPVSTFDPASIVIPKDAALPEHFKKYGGKTLADIIELDLKTQQYGSQQRGEADRLRKENENLTARLAAREELTALLTPEKPAVDDWERVGITAETPVWDQPRTALEATRKLASEDTEKIVDDRVSKALAKLEADRDAKDRNAAAIQTFETAKGMLRAEGHAITDDEWSREFIPYIAPKLAQEETVTPGVFYDPKQYVERYHRLRGAPAKPVIPGETAPPISARAASITPQMSAPTASSEAVAMKQKVASSLVAQGKWTKEEAAAYMGGN